MASSSLFFFSMRRWSLIVAQLILLISDETTSWMITNSGWPLSRVVRGGTESRTNKSKQLFSQTAVPSAEKESANEENDESAHQGQQQVPPGMTVWDEIHCRFELHELEGASSKCRIYEAKPFDSDTLVAIKVSNRHDMMHREAQVYEHLNNNELFAEVYEYHPPRNDHDDVSAIIMERGETDFYKLLAKNTTFSPSDLRHIANQTGRIIHAIHQQGLVWTEVKSANFITQSKDTPNPYHTIKAIDFESTVWINQTNILNTAPYAPPEFALEDLCGREVPMEPSFDIWSYGMLLYELATGSMYFVNKHHDRVGIFSYLKNAQEMDLSKLGQHDPRFQDLVRGCLQMDPKQRITSAEIVNHPYFQEDTDSQTKSSETSKILHFL